MWGALYPAHLNSVPASRAAAIQHVFANMLAREFRQPPMHLSTPGMNMTHIVRLLASDSGMAWTPGQQADAVDCVNAIINVLSIPRHLVLRYMKQCQHCFVSTQSGTAESHNVFRVGMPLNQELTTALTAAFQPSQHILRCDNCQCDRPHSRQLHVTQWPHLLPIVVNRWQINPQGCAWKDHRRLSCPTSFTIQTGDGRCPEIQYRLKAVLIHHGNTLHSGHYTAHVQRSRQWYLADDTAVRPLSEATATTCAAYITFYEAAWPTNTVPQPHIQTPMSARDRPLPPQNDIEPHTEIHPAMDSLNQPKPPLPQHNQPHVPMESLPQPMNPTISADTQTQAHVDNCRKQPPQIQSPTDQQQQRGKPDCRTDMQPHAAIQAAVHSFTQPDNPPLPPHSQIHTPLQSLKQPQNPTTLANTQTHDPISTFTENPPRIQPHAQQHNTAPDCKRKRFQWSTDAIAKLAESTKKRPRRQCTWSQYAHLLHNDLGSPDAPCPAQIQGRLQRTTGPRKLCPQPEAQGPCNHDDDCQATGPACAADNAAEPNSKPNAIAKFHDACTQTCDNLCACCEQLWFPTSVRGIRPAVLDGLPNDIRDALCKDRHGNIINSFCTTCHTHLARKSLPAYAKPNGIRFPVLPLEITQLNTLEARLVAMRIEFGRFHELPRSRQHSLKGSIINVPVNMPTLQTCLPRTLHDTDTLFCKLKRRTTDAHAYISQTIRPEYVRNALRVLLQTPLYQEHHATECHTAITQLGTDIIPLDQDEDLGTGPISRIAQPQEAPLDTMVQSDEPPHMLLDGQLHIAPGQGQVPNGLVRDKDAEELAYPNIFGGHRRQETQLSYKQLCTWELRSVDRRAARDVENIFFKLRKSQVIDTIHATCTRLHKQSLHGRSLTAENMLDDSILQELQRNGVGYKDMSHMRTSPDYMENNKKEGFAQLRQLDVPTFFITLTAADMHWTEMLQCMEQTATGVRPTAEDVNNWNYIKRSDVLRDDPVTATRYYHHRMQAFYHHILHGNEALGKITDLIWADESQTRGVLHRHGLLWTENAPRYDSDPDQDAIAFIDRYISCNRRILSPELQKVQEHHCSTWYCRFCRFGAPWFPMRSTIILREYPDPPVDADHLKQLLRHFQTKIACLDNILSKDKDSDEKKQTYDMTYEQFLKYLGTDHDTYLRCIRLTLKRSAVFLRRGVCDMRINSYNLAMLQTNRANMDVSFVLHPFGAATYMFSYMMKGEKGMSKLMNQISDEAQCQGTAIRDRIRSMSQAFIRHQEICASRAVCILLGLPMKYQSRACIWVPTSREADRVRRLKTRADLQNLPPSAHAITFLNVIDWFRIYATQIDGRGDNMCLADFAAWYQLTSTPSEHADNTSDDIDSNDIDDASRHDAATLFIRCPVAGKLPSECIADLAGNTPAASRLPIRSYRRRTKPKVLRTRRFNRLTDPDDYFREQLLLYLPASEWASLERGNEENALLGNCDNFTDQFLCHRDIISQAQKQYDPNADLDWDSIRQDAENTAHDHELPLLMPNDQEPYNLDWDIDPALAQAAAPGAILINCPSRWDTDIFLGNVTRLNSKQLQYFKNYMHKLIYNHDPCFEFCTGGAGTGKSLLLKTIVQATQRWFDMQPGANPDTMKVVVMAYTAKAAYAVDGDTVHATTGLLPQKSYLSQGHLTSARRNGFQNTYHDLRIVIIDEMSLVGARLMHAIDNRFKDIFGSRQPFGGLAVLAFGDLFQLKPISDTWCFLHPPDLSFVDNVWRNFHMFELTEVMRQTGTQFAQRLLRLREGQQTPDDVRWWMQHECRFQSAPPGTPHLFFSNASCHGHNESILAAHAGDLIISTAIDTIDGATDPDWTARKLRQAAATPAKRTSQLHTTIRLKPGIPVELTHNIDKPDGLHNGLEGHFHHMQYTHPEIAWLHFRDPRIGARQRRRFQYLYNQHPDIPTHWTPIPKSTKEFWLGLTTITRTQFPIFPSSGRTIHKSQGLTLDAVSLDLRSPHKQPGLHYVALSRVTDETNLYFSHPHGLSWDTLTIDADVQTEMHRLRTQAPVNMFVPNLELQTHNYPHLTLFISHNIRSLQAYHQHAYKDRDILAAHVLHFTETRFVHPPPIPHTTHALAGQIRAFDDAHGRPHNGSVLLIKRGIPWHPIFQQNSCGIEIIAILLRPFLHPFLVIAVYRSPASNSTTHLLHILEPLLSTYRASCDVCIMGDFNIDLLHPSPAQHSLVSLCTQYSLSQVIPHHTTHSKALLDHIWLSHTPAQTDCMYSPFSDHFLTWALA